MKPDKTKTEVKKLTAGEIGRTGTMIFSGYISGEEYSADLQGVKGLRKYDEMRRSDATVRASLLAIFLPLLEANWYITPASGDRADLEAAEHIEKNLFHGMEIPWPDFMRQALLYLVYGRFVFEKVYGVDEQGKIIIRKFAPRLPQTITKWEMTNGQPGVHQVTVHGSFDIPMEKLLIFVNEKEGDNWEGISILRSAYKHWYMKDNIYKIEAMSLERQGLGVPIITTPANATKEDQEKAKEIAKNMRANEKSYAQISEGWKIELLDMKASGLKNPQAAILHHDRQITKNILAQFLELGSGETGSFALSRDQSALFTLSLNAVAKYFAGVINQEIAFLTKLNFNVTDSPRLGYSDIGQTDYNNLSASIQRFAQSNMLTPTPRTEDHIRDLLDLPEIGEAERAEQDLTRFLDSFDKQEPAVMWGSTKAPQGELKKLILEKRIELEERRLRGKVTPEWVSKAKIEILKKQAELVDSLDFHEHNESFKMSSHHDDLAGVIERIDHAIAKLSA